MYHKIAATVVTALVLASSASTAVSMPRDGYGFSAAEKAWFERASRPSDSN
jgi:hypothetical protein